MPVVELDYNIGTVALFSRISDQPWSMLLDSSRYTQIHHGHGRYDIIVAQPVITLETYGLNTIINYGTQQPITSTEDPFLIIKKYLADHVSQTPDNLPFCGGAVGYFAYDLAHRIHQLANIAISDIKMPDMAIGIYDWAIVVDHLQKRSVLASLFRFESTKTHWQNLIRYFTTPPLQKKGADKIRQSIKANLSKLEYENAFNKIKRYLFEGDCYQVNFAQRFSAPCQQDSWGIYLNLREVNPAPYSAYIKISSGAVLSSSPEKFLSVNNKQIKTRPIKGTIHRSKLNAEKDHQLAKALTNSEKDIAENLMIIDLLRNDLGKSCIPGSIKVPKQFVLETYTSVHHLVSEITGSLADDKHALDLLRDCFPGGSITGAPKLRAMQIIEELEQYHRSVYCGSVAYIGFDGNMDSNICIRTLIHNQQKLYLYAGGGLVWDSMLDSEYQECIDKIKAVLSLFKNPQQHDSRG